MPNHEFSVQEALSKRFKEGRFVSALGGCKPPLLDKPPLLALLVLFCSLAQAAEKPDVLILLTDQWSPRYLSWENKEVRTPNLDKIAAEGMIFDACYVTSPVCMPARVSLITGLYPHNAGHSLWGNGNNYCIPVEEAPMYRDIQRAGLTTAHIGKTHWTSGPAWQEHFKNSGAFFKALGIDHIADISGPPDSNRGRGIYTEHLRQRGILDAVAGDLHARYLSGEFAPSPSKAPVEDYHDVFTTGLAVDIIRQQPRDKPLCLVVSLHSPHPPLDAPGDYATMFDPEKLTLPANVPEKYLREGRALNHERTKLMLANYLGKIALVDDCLARLVEAMRERGTWDSAFFAFTADHGEMMGAHGYLTKGRFYEESVRVPLVLRWPGQVKAGRSKAPVQMMDIYPTIVEAAGGELTPNRFAKSLLPVARGERERIRPIAISEIGNSAPLRIMARDERHKYWADEEEEFLFDLETDPLEQTNLAKSSSHEAALNLMRQKLLTHLRSTQVNLAAGSKSKVQRLREAEEKKKDK